MPELPCAQAIAELTVATAQAARATDLQASREKGITILRFQELAS
jgi:hypothetical protein